MIRETRHLVIFITVIIVIMAFFTFYVTYTFFHQEEEAPRRSRPVVHWIRPPA